MTLRLDGLLQKAERTGAMGHAADNLRMTRLQFDYLRFVSNMWAMYEAFQLAESRESLLELKKHVDAFEDFRHRILHMDPDDAALRFPDWGQLCKWLVGEAGCVARKGLQQRGGGGGKGVGKGGGGLGGPRLVVGAQAGGAAAGGLAREEGRRGRPRAAEAGLARQRGQSHSFKLASKALIASLLARVRESYASS